MRTSRPRATGLTLERAERGVVHPGCRARGSTTARAGSARRVLRPQGRGSFRAVLSNFPFLRLWIAQSVSQTANSMVDFSLLLLVGEAVAYHNVAQANTAVSFVILAFSLPAVIFGPIAGAVADRVSRRNLMVADEPGARRAGDAVPAGAAHLASAHRAGVVLHDLVSVRRRRPVLHAGPGRLDPGARAAGPTHGGERAVQPDLHRDPAPGIRASGTIAVAGAWRGHPVHGDDGGLRHLGVADGLAAADAASGARRDQRKRPIRSGASGPTSGKGLQLHPARPDPGEGDRLSDVRHDRLHARRRAGAELHLDRRRLWRRAISAIWWRRLDSA